MNSKYRILALLICFALISCIPGTAEEMAVAPNVMVPAEETSTDAINLMPEAVDVPVELPIIEAEAVIPVSTEEPAEVNLPVLPELTLLSADNQIDEIDGLASGSNYSQGYAKLTIPTTGYASASPNAEAIIYLEDGVFYVSDRRTSSSSDRLRIHFADGDTTRSVWVDERCLKPLNAEEVLDFVSSRLGENGVRLFGGDPMLPLDTPFYSSVVTYSKPEQENAQKIPAMLVNQTRMTLDAGSTLPIGVSFSDGRGHSVQFASEDETIASVSEDGRVTGISAGSTHIQIRSEFSNVAMIEILVQE